MRLVLVVSSAISLLWGCGYDWARFDPSAAERDAGPVAPPDATTALGDGGAADGGASDAGSGDGDAGPPDPLAEGLVLYLAFDEGEGATTLEAVSGEPLGRLQGDATLAVAGVRGGALAVAGDGHVVVRPATPLALGTAYTVAAWLRRDPGSDDDVVLSCTRDPRFILTTVSLGRLSLRAYDAISSEWTFFDATSSEGAVPYEEWVHLAGVTRGTELTLYVNGIEVGRETIAETRSSDATESFCYVGQTGYSWSESHTEGAIDEVRVYDRALDGEAIWALAAP